MVGVCLPIITCSAVTHEDGDRRDPRVDGHTYQHPMYSALLLDDWPGRSQTVLSGVMSLQVGGGQATMHSYFNARPRMHRSLAVAVTCQLLRAEKHNPSRARQGDPTEDNEGGQPCFG